MAILKRSLLRALSGAVSIVVYLLSLKRVRTWAWNKVTGRVKSPSAKIVDAKGEIVDRAHKS